MRPMPSSRLRSLGWFALLSAPVLVHAQDVPVLVKDINTYQAPGRGPTHLTEVNGQLFFTLADPALGTRLWRSDGTAAGTFAVKDPYPGTGDAAPDWLTSFNGLLYFVAEDGTHGRELWRSDGSTAGTALVKDILPGGTNDPSYPPPEPSELTVIDGTLFFAAEDDTHGRELWRSDGTAAGTLLVKDTVPGIAGGSPSDLTNVSGTLFFTVGSQIWRSDGTNAGTVMVNDLLGGGQSIQELTSVGAALFFTAFDATNE